MDLNNLKSLVSVMLCTLLVVLNGEATSQQKFKEEPADVRVGAGNVAILNCIVENAVGSVQWTKGGFALGPNRSLPGYPRYQIIGNEKLGEHNLMITNAQIEDDSEYDCQVTRTESSPGLKSRTATVTVLIPPEKPTIEDGSTEVEVTAGKAQNITCYAKQGKPAANITWFYEGQPVTGNTYYSITSQGKRQDAESKLEINADRTHGGQRYECRVISSAMSSYYTVHATLKVLYTPDVKMTVIPEKRVTEKGSIKLFCEGNGNPPDLSWKWYRGNEVIPNENTNMLVLREVTREYHSNKISCEATNKVGSARESYTLNVEYGATFTSKPKHTAINVGEDATISCTVDGNPTPTVVWTRKDSNRILGSSNTLTLKAVQEHQFGVYTCKASVIGFPVIEQDVYLLKKSPPKVISSKVQFAHYRESARVECDVLSAPKPDAIVWKRDGQVLDGASSDGTFHIQEQDTPKGRKSILEIARVLAYDMGEYNCSVKNSYGQDYLVITLQPKEVTTTAPAKLSGGDANQPNAVPLAKILGGVFGGLSVVLVVVLIVVYVYRRKITGGDSDTESSTSSDPKRKKKEGSPDIKVEYSNKYGSNVEQWRNDVDLYRRSADYDELNYPSKDLKGNNNAFDHDYPDGGYGTYNGAPPRQFRENRDPVYNGSLPRKFNDRYDVQAYPPPSTIEIRHHAAPPPGDYLTDYAHTSVTAGHLSTNV